MKKHNDVPPETTNTSPSPEAPPMKRGVIAMIRESPHVPPEDVPTPPPGAVTLDAEQKRSEVHWVHDGSHAELNEAMAEAEQQSGELAQTCGSMAPDTAEVSKLSRRIAALAVTTRKAEALFAASSTQLQVARSDAHETVKSLADTVRFAAKRDPQILSRWPAVLRYADAHATKVVDGKAKAKRAREAAKKAEAKKAEAKPASDKPASDKPASDKPTEG